MREDLAFTFRDMLAQLPLACFMFLLVVLQDMLEGGSLPLHLAPKAFALCMSFACAFAFCARRSIRLANPVGTIVAHAEPHPAGSTREG